VLREAVPVPGGWLAVDRPRHESPVIYWIKAALLAGLYSVGGVARDIVILDPSGGRELYREGPYDGITISQPLKALEAELKRTGVEEFVRVRQLHGGQPGPISQPSGRITVMLRLSLLLHRARKPLSRRG
jgi:hypothetical protein